MDNMHTSTVNLMLAICLYFGLDLPGRLYGKVVIGPIGCQGYYKIYTVITI